MLYLGIDQHRKQLTVCVRNEQGDVISRRQVSTEWKRVRESADQNRQGVADERAVRERASDPSRP